MILLFLSILVSFFMALSIGANDTCMSMAVGAGAIGMRKAMYAGAVFEFLGATLMGGQVSGTISKGMINPSVFASDLDLYGRAMVCVSLGSAVWMIIATFFALPVSTTHSIVGALVGVGVYIGGWECISVNTLQRTVMSWVTSPFLGLLVAYVVFLLIKAAIFDSQHPLERSLSLMPALVAVTTLVLSSTLLPNALALFGITSYAAIIFFAVVIAVALAEVYREKVSPDQRQRLKDRHEQGQDTEALPVRAGPRHHESEVDLAEEPFIHLVVGTGLVLSFAHASNDVSNAVGTLGAILEAYGYAAEGEGTGSHILAMGGAGMVVGLLLLNRVYATLGNNITKLTFARGFAAQLSTAISVMIATQLGMPISSTHVMVGAVAGVALTEGASAINLGTIKKIIMSWLVTVPAAAAITLVCFVVLAMVYAPPAAGAEIAMTAATGAIDSTIDSSVG